MIKSKPRKQTNQIAALGQANPLNNPILWSEAYNAAATGANGDRKRNKNELTITKEKLPNQRRPLLTVGSRFGAKISAITSVTRAVININSRSIASWVAIADNKPGTYLNFLR